MHYQCECHCRCAAVAVNAARVSACIDHMHHWRHRKQKAAEGHMKIAKFSIACACFLRACAPLPGAAPCCTGCQAPECQEYRLSYSTVYEERQMTAYRLEYDTVYEERPVTSYRPVLETEMRERRYTVARPVFETAEREERVHRRSGP